MTVTNYLKRKYSMTDKTTVPISFIMQETLLSKSEIRKTLPKMLNLKHPPVSLTFFKFCMVVEEYINVAE